MAIIFLAFLVLVAYANSLNNVFVSDDVAAIPQNPNVGTVKSILTQMHAFVQPLLYLIAFKIGGLNPAVYRLINIIFHIGTVWAVFILITILSNTTLAFFTAVFFAIHPVFTESVSWISGGNYVRYSFFMLSSLIIYIKSQENKKLYLLSLVLFTLSISSSDKAIVAPLLFLLFEFSLGQLRKNWKRLIPFFALATFWILFYLSQIGNRITSVSIQNYSQPIVFNLLIQIPIAISSYLRLLVWPDKLTLYHSEMSFSQIEYLIRLIGFVGLVGLIGLSWFKNQQIFFWLSFFIISLLPTFTPFGISWIVAERYVYLGTVGILFVISYGLWLLTKNKKTETLGYLIFIIIVISFIIRTILRNIDWKNEDNLWIATGKTSPSYNITHNNLGDVYGRRGDFQRAIEEFKLAIKIKPNYADAYHNLGNTYRQIGKVKEATESYKTAFKLNPYLWQSPMNIAAIYFEQGKYQEAADYMLSAVKVNPKNSSLHSNLGIIYLKAGEKKKAEEAFISALQIDPNNQQAKLGLVEITK